MYVIMCLFVCLGVLIVLNFILDDHSRVTLKDAYDTDYINANYVQCKLAKRQYILAQGPLLNTCEHFWQMVWEQNSRGIIMLNRIYENKMVNLDFC